MPQQTRRGGQRVRAVLPGASGSEAEALNLADFHYDLPHELIAQTPLEDRAASRMLVLDRTQQRWEDRRFRDLPGYLRPGDCLVLNGSRVFPSRLYGQRKGLHAREVGKTNPKRWQHLSGTVEMFLLRSVSPDGRMWNALVRPGRKMLVGERIHFADGLDAEILQHGEFGERTIRFECAGDIYEHLDRVGHMPLPPYIKRADQPEDRERYQTVYARERGSVAAPTAGLHFTPEVLESCRNARAEIANVTLHVGLGTFQPLHSTEVEQNQLHAESFAVTEENQRKIRTAARRVAVGTTSVRAVENVMRGRSSGETDLFIYPGFEFLGVNALLTNFHLPSTSLLLLVAAFAGKEFVLAAYRHAVEERYRFFSYGDCMLIF